MASSQEARDFKGVWIPRDIWLDDRLSAVEKVLFAEIDSLSGGELGCIKTNKSLAEFCQCSERTVTQGISHLKELGLVEVESFNGRQRVLRGCLAKFARQGSKNCEAGSQNLRGLYLVSNTPSNTSSNTEIRTEKAERRKTKPFVPPTVEDVRAYAAEKGYHFNPQSFFDYYETSNWHFRNGKPVKNWKQCCVTWENTWKEGHPSYKNRSQADYSEFSIDNWERG